MALKRLEKDQVYRFYLASPLAFANWQAPTLAELNSNPTNAPDGLIFNITCALDTSSTTFDLDGSETDDSTTFCQDAGSQSVMERSATVEFGINLSKERWTNAATPTLANGYNVSTMAQSLLMWRGIEYFGILSVGKGPDVPFAVGDRIKMAEFATDWGVVSGGSGENLIMSNSTASRSRLAWNVKIAA